MAQGQCAHLSLHWRHHERAPPRPGTTLWIAPPRRTRGVSRRPARRVALPSSPAETLRLCEPYADTDGARCSGKCQMSRSCRPKVRLPRAWERRHVFDDASWYLRPVSNFGAERKLEMADPTAVALYWKALPVPEPRMRACTPYNELMSHPRVDSSRNAANDSSPTPWQGLCVARNASCPMGMQAQRRSGSTPVVEEQ